MPQKETVVMSIFFWGDSGLQQLILIACHAAKFWNPTLEFAVTELSHFQLYLQSER